MKKEDIIIDILKEQREDVKDLVKDVCEIKVDVALNKEDLKEKFGIGDILLYKTFKEIGYDNLPDARIDLGGQLNFELRRYMKYSKHVLETILILSNNNKYFTARMLGNCLKISEKGGYHHISHHLLCYGLVEELPNQIHGQKRRYRITKYGKEFLFKLFSKP